ncbi:hypothetical protein UPYG_G00305320, partial [Umbra pygmaea]
ACPPSPSGRRPSGFYGAASPEDTETCDSSKELELKDVKLRAGDHVEVKGKIKQNAQRFQIDLGCDSDNLALHFNPRFQDGSNDALLVCNSKCDGCWGVEHREEQLHLQRGSSVKIVVKLTGDMFEMELPDGQEIQFPNRQSLDVITYVRIRGDFKFTGIKLC